MSDQLERRARLDRRAFGKALVALTALRGAAGAASPSRPDTAAFPHCCRADFPALDQQINGRPLVYLDSAATTQRPEAVIRSLTDFYRHQNANPSARQHTLARRANDRYEAARSTLARFLNAKSADEIVWVRGTTEGINLVASCLARFRLQPGDEILLTIAEHASNLLPWRQAARATGATVRFIDVDDSGRLSIADLERKLNRRTRIVAFSHVSNVAGFINPASEICQRARQAGALVLVDAAQSAPHIQLDVQALDCDFLAFSSHKLLGPMGIGVLWTRRELLDEMPPYQAGSNMAHDIDLDAEVMEAGARKFGAGTPNAAGPIGLAAAIQYFEATGRERIEKHEAELTEYMLPRFAAIPGVRILGPGTPERRIPVFAFTLGSLAPRQIQQALDEQGIAIRAGDLSALPLLKRFGVRAAARASCYFYTQLEELEQFLTVLRRIAIGA